MLVWAFWSLWSLAEICRGDCSMARMSASVYSPFTSVGATQRGFLAALSHLFDDEEHSEVATPPEFFFKE